MTDSQPTGNFAGLFRTVCRYGKRSHPGRPGGLVLAVGLAGLAYWQRGVAVHQTQIAEERQFFAEQQRQIALKQRALAEQNEAQAKEQPDQALLTQSCFLADIATQRTNEDAGAAVLLALDALPDARWKIERPYTPEAEAALFGARQRLREATVLSGHTEQLSSASFSPDGMRLVTGSWDKTARIWEIKIDETVTILSGHTGNVVSAAFSPSVRLAKPFLLTRASACASSSASSLSCLSPSESFAIFSEMTMKLCMCSSVSLICFDS
jgi:hypothetical protein